MANTETRRRPFKYELAADEKGRYAAFSQEEPAFWFIRNSEAEAIAAAEETFRDYVTRFGQAMEPSHVTRDVTVYQFKKTRELEVA